MRSLVLIAATMMLCACSPAANRATTNTASTTAANALPDGFPSGDVVSRAAECAVYLGLSQQANATPGGHDGPSIERAAGAWRGSLRTGAHMSEDEAQQLIGSSVNPLTSTPSAQRDAASAWCIDNTPAP